MLNLHIITEKSLMWSDCGSIIFDAKCRGSHWTWLAKTSISTTKTKVYIYCNSYLFIYLLWYYYDIIIICFFTDVFFKCFHCWVQNLRFHHWNIYVSITLHPAMFWFHCRFQRAQKQLQKVYTAQLSSIRRAPRNGPSEGPESPPQLNTSTGYRTRAPPAVAVPRKSRYANMVIVIISKAIKLLHIVIF